MDFLRALKEFDTDLLYLLTDPQWFEDITPYLLKTDILDRTFEEQELLLLGILFPDDKNELISLQQFDNLKDPFIAVSNSNPPILVLSIDGHEAHIFRQNKTNCRTYERISTGRLVNHLDFHFSFDHLDRLFVEMERDQFTIYRGIVFPTIGDLIEIIEHHRTKYTTMINEDFDRRIINKIKRDWETSEEEMIDKYHELYYRVMEFLSLFLSRFSKSSIE